MRRAYFRTCQAAQFLLLWPEWGWEDLPQACVPGPILHKQIPRLSPETTSLLRSRLWTKNQPQRLLLWGSPSHAEPTGPEGHSCPRAESVPTLVPLHTVQTGCDSAGLAAGTVMVEGVSLQLSDVFQAPPDTTGGVGGAASLWRQHWVVGREAQERETGSAFETLNLGRIEGASDYSLVSEGPC